ncbi:5200_t:CDS:2 [Cetraspora pellucida]|uniref:5200_t:CDS:1 n=1 Tax=Cetraspora pellucida TaxID=1433469 RepID=A0ACA9K4Z5_9GLOM|nr:5200_t:CDS:2 [Cetraspora pellucida]
MSSEQASNKRSTNSFEHTSKRRCLNLRIPKLPDYDSGSTKLYVMGSNDCGQLGLENVDEVKFPKHIENLDKFRIVYISVGSLYATTLTQNGKIVTWGCNDHGALDRITESKDNERVPSYAQGIDNVTIVKVTCGGNITLALLSDGHNFLTKLLGYSKDENGVLGFSAKNKDKLEQNFFIKYDTDTKSKIANISVGENHSLLLTTEGFIYIFGSGDINQLGRRILKHYKWNGLNSEKLAIRRIKKIFAGSYHNFAVDNDNIIYANVYSFGHTNYGQLGIGEVSTDKVSTPIHITKLVNCQNIAVGDHNSLAVNEKVHTWGFGKTFALGDRSREDKNLLFEINCTGIGNKILSVGGGSQYSVILFQ